MLVTVGNAPKGLSPLEPMETDRTSDTDLELSFESCSEPDENDYHIPPSSRSVSREELSQSICFGIPGPAEKVACSTLLETPDKPTKSNPSFQIPASVSKTPTQSQILQKDMGNEIMKKLDKIIENQVVILSQLQIRTQDDDVIDHSTVDEVPAKPLPQLIATPAMQIDNFLQSDDLRGATNVSPLVDDAMLAETLKLKPKSSSAGNLATKLVKIIFKTDEIVNRNCSGSRGKDKLDQEKLNKLITYVCKAYGVVTEEQTKMTGRQCRLAIDEFLRRGNRARAKDKVIR